MKIDTLPRGFRHATTDTRARFVSTLDVGVLHRGVPQGEAVR
jgi:hypothetical protein